MNQTLGFCFSYSINVTYLTLSHLVILTVINVIVMVGNVILNTLAIYVLTKTKQLFNVACNFNIKHVRLTDRGTWPKFIFVSTLQSQLFD